MADSMVSALDALASADMAAADLLYVVDTGTPDLDKKLRLDELLKNLRVNLATVGTSGVGVVVIPNGTLPTSQPADTVQICSADYASGDARMLVLAEQGRGLWIGNGTLEARAPTSGAGNSLTLRGSDAVSGNTNGGNVVLTPGALSGSGVKGSVVCDGHLKFGALNGYTTSISIGSSDIGAVVGNANTVLIGGTSAGVGSVVIGISAKGNTGGGNSEVYIGYNAGNVNGIASVAIGANADPGTGGNVFVSGSSAQPMTNVYFGKGLTNATPTAWTLNGTGGSGTNIAGANIQIAGGKGTGDATGGDVVFLTSDAGGSGTALQSLTEKARLKVGGGWLSRVVVEANTAGSGAPNVLAATESGTVLTNEGSTAQNYHTLPTAVAGLDFEFVCQDSDGIRVVAASGDTIRDVGTVSGDAGFIQSTTVGSVIRLLAINATEWFVVSKQGTWTIDS